LNYTLALHAPCPLSLLLHFLLFLLSVFYVSPCSAVCFNHVARANSELSMGPFCVTRSNPTHQLTDPTRPNPIQRTDSTAWCNQIFSNRALNALTQSCQSLVRLLQCTQLKPTHGSTQLMDGQLCANLMVVMQTVLAWRRARPVELSADTRKPVGLYHVVII